MEENVTVEEIYRTLENEIVSLAIQPGEHLSENTLCKRFSVSRTPIRSALQRLERNHFVSIIPHKGTIVTPVNIETANQMIYQRLAVETMVFRDFVSICTPMQSARVSCAMDELEEISRTGYEKEPFHINRFLEADLAMHKIWFYAMGKKYLWESLTRPQADYSRFIRLDIIGGGNVADVVAEHRQMQNIIDSKDMDAIEPLMKRHLYGGIRRLGNMLFSSRYKDFFA